MQNLVNSLKKLLLITYKTMRYQIINMKIKIAASKSPIRVIIGAGGLSQKGWIPTDKDHINMLLIEDWQRYFSGNSVDALFAEHVWEHLTEADGITAAKNCYAYLKPGGYLRIAVPDGFHPSIEYRDAVKPMGSGFGSDDHKVLYTHISLKRVFETVGFSVELLEYFDESGEFHQKEWNSNDGFVARSMGFDERNKDGNPNYTSIILDAWKKMDLLK